MECGFCRFSKWIESQRLPKNLKTYCKGVLRYLGKNDPQFMPVSDDSSEDELEDESSGEDEDESSGQDEESWETLDEEEAPEEQA